VGGDSWGSAITKSGPPAPAASVRYVTASSSMEQPLKRKAEDLGQPDDEPVAKRADADSAVAATVAASSAAQLALHTEEHAATRASRAAAHRCHQPIAAPAARLTSTHAITPAVTAESLAASALPAAANYSGAPGSCSVGDPPQQRPLRHTRKFHDTDDVRMDDAESTTPASSVITPRGWLSPVSDVRSPAEALAHYCSSARVHSALNSLLRHGYSGRRLTKQLAALLYNTMLQSLAKYLLADPQPRGVADVEQRVDELLTGRLGVHAKGTIAEHVNSFSRAPAAERAFATHGGLEYLGLLLLPLLPTTCSSPPLLPPLRVAVTSALECIVGNVLHNAALRCTLHGARYVGVAALLETVREVKELQLMLERLGVADAFKQVPNAATLARRFPKTQVLQQQLCERYAWFHHPPAVELVLARFLRGDLPQGDVHYWQRLHIRPVAYFGRHFWPHAMHGEWRFGDDPAASDSDDDDDDAAAACGRSSAPFRSLTVELVDAAGREFSVLVQTNASWNGLAELFSLSGGVSLAKVSLAKVSALLGSCNCSSLRRPSRTLLTTSRTSSRSNSGSDGMMSAISCAVVGSC